MEDGSSLTVYDQSNGSNMGELTATGGYAQAGIGGGDGGTGGTITINGGTITARGGSGSAGIGGGNSSAGGTIINGGIVTANSTTGAGIGDGSGGTGGTFTTEQNGNAFIIASSISDNSEDTHPGSVLAY